MTPATTAAVDTAAAAAATASAARDPERKLGLRAIVRPSPVGDVVVAFSSLGVVSVDLAESPSGTVVAPTGSASEGEAPWAAEGLDETPWSAEGLDRALAGEPARDHGITFDLRVPPFFGDVLEAALTIPRGEVRTYSWLAATAGRPNAVRAAGSAMARNPVPLLIPCHRVVRAGGHLGAYSLGGSENKRRLLESEGFRQ